MDISRAHDPSFHVNALGGVAIGLLLAVGVIFGGFSLILDSEVELETSAYPAWVDQRFASADPYQAVPTSRVPVESIVVAEAAR